MKNILVSLSLFSLFTCLVFSCTKNTGPEEPVITITNPTDTTNINAGDTIEIKGALSDNINLHEFYLTIKNNSTDSVLVYDNPYVHGGKTYPFNYLWITRDSAIYKLTLKVLDHESHTTSKEVLIHVN
ncbi:MAG: Ig-like domain-containing protein [Bacteroidetes bacterium]|nr:Ig-like domain-containing protein [Bacteroidota bacterium]